MKKLIFCLFVLLFPYFCYALEFEVRNEVELENAILNEECTLIILEDDITLSKSINIGKKVEIDGNKHILTYDSLYTGNMFNISSNGELYLSNVVIDGGNSWNWISDELRNDPYKTNLSEVINLSGISISSNVFIVNGKLELNNSVIKNYYLSSSNVAIINALGSADEKVNININDTKINNCYGILMMLEHSNVLLDNNTIIENNFGFGNKGGLFQLSRSVLTLNDVNVDNNIGMARSGSLFGVVNDSYLIMNGGSIKDNIAKYYSSSSTGSMITIESGGGFVMNAGVIENNLGTLASVISSRWTDGVNGSSDSKMFFNGGKIANNRTYLNTWNNATIYFRSNGTIGKNMVVDGDVVVNTSSEGFVNEGVINGNLVVNSASAKAINNGVVKGNTLITAGSIINNGVLENVYETNVNIVDNGTINGEYVSIKTPTGTQKVVTIDGNGGKINDKYSKFDILIENGIAFDINSYVNRVDRDGYTFVDEWYFDSECLSKFNNMSNIESNITLYANYNINKYTISWEIDGKIVEYEYDYNTEIDVVEDIPTKDGYRFLGWEGYQDNMKVPANDVKFIAKWEKIDNPNTSDEFAIFKIIVLLSISFIAFMIKAKKKIKVYE